MKTCRFLRVAHGQVLCLILIAASGHFAELAAAQDASMPDRIEIRGTTMGTVAWQVIVYGDPDDATRYQTLAQAALDDVNERMSTYRPDSEVSRFNASRSTDWFDVSSDTAIVVAQAQAISRESGGAFDITVQPLVNLWRFGPDTSDLVVPDDATVEAIRDKIGYDKLTVRADPPALRKSIPELQIDLSAIAKGYAVDQVWQALESAGLDNGFVEVGGEVYAAGDKPNGQPWVVGIEQPDVDQRREWSRVELFQKALASSGDYRNFHEVDGKRYSHTIDPTTGYPVENGPAAVSVMADTCMMADALATAAMVLGPNMGRELGREFGAEVLVLTRTPSGEFLAARTEGFDDKPVPVEAAGGDPKQAGGPSLTETMIFASVFFLVAVLAMSVGVILGRKRLAGSCGGIAALDDPNAEAKCALCSNPGKECRELKKAVQRQQSQ